MKFVHIDIVPFCFDIMDCIYHNYSKNWTSVIFVPVARERERERERDHFSIAFCLFGCHFCQTVSKKSNLVLGGICYDAVYKF